MIQERAAPRGGRDALYQQNYRRDADSRVPIALLKF